MADNQGSNRRQRTNDGKQPWQAKYTFEAMLNGPCKFHSGAKPAMHTTRQCSWFTKIMCGDALPPAPPPPPPPRREPVVPATTIPSRTRPTLSSQLRITTSIASASMR
ncbi:hypothetical protein D1007_34828 [Hordeum vulgare]|nr:hypothetical protein D1007_34828 [Hordeum vulgare]